MLSKTIKYTNAFGVEKEKVAYFSLTQEEILEIKEKYSNVFDSIKGNNVDEEVDNMLEILSAVKEVVFHSYFETDETGDMIVKDKEVKNKFINSFAGQALMEELMSSEGSAKEFIAAILPVSSRQSVEEAMAKGLIS